MAQFVQQLAQGEVQVLLSGSIQAIAGKQAFTDLGVAVNSGEYDGLPTNEFKAKITADLDQKGLGRIADRLNRLARGCTGDSRAVGDG